MDKDNQTAEKLNYFKAISVTFRAILEAF